MATTREGETINTYPSTQRSPYGNLMMGVGSDNITRFISVDSDGNIITSGDSVLGNVGILNGSDTRINPATEESLSQIVMSIDNAIDQTVFDLNASAFTATTNVSNDFILDNVEFNFSTVESKTIIITSTDGTQIWKDTNINKNVVLSDINVGINANENVTITVTQFSSAGTMDCILKVKQGSNTLVGNPVLGTGANLYGIPYDFLTEVNRGNVPGMAMKYWFGNNSNITSTNQHIWGFGGTMTHLASAETMNIISSDTTNDVAGGSGARSVKLIGVDGSLNEIEETVNLAATNTLTTNSFFRVFSMKVIDVGTYGGTNLGQITATSSSSATVQSSVEIADGQSNTTHYTVPAGKTGYLIRVGITMESKKQVHVHTTIRPNADVIIAPFSSTRDIHHWEGIDTPVSERLLSNHILSEKTDIWFTGHVETGTAKIQVDYAILLVDN